MTATSLMPAAAAAQARDWSVATADADKLHGAIGRTQVDNFILVKRDGGGIYGNVVHCAAVRSDGFPRLAGLRGFCPQPALADAVEDIWDLDIPDSTTARKLLFKSAPSTNPLLFFQYRVALTSDRDFGATTYHDRPWRHVAVKMQSGIVTLRPAGPVGMVIVRLRPEAAGRLLFAPMQEFMDTNVHLHDLFDPHAIDQVEEALGEAGDGQVRANIVQDFLIRHAKPQPTSALLAHAAARLRSKPSLPVGRLASELDISERHLSRGFRGVFGTGPKHFARVLRVEKAIESRRSGGDWADIAYDVGFADQAHLVHDFNAITGAAPEAIFRPLVGGGALPRVTRIFDVPTERPSP